MKSSVFPQRVKMSTPSFKTYKLKYMYGVWITKEIIAAEDRQEAIQDAKDVYNNSGLVNWSHPVALFCGNKIVFRFK